MGICLQVWVCGLRIIGCWLLIVKETHWFLVFRLSYEGEHLRVSTTESSSPPLSFRNLSIPKPRLNYFIEMTGHHAHAPVVRAIHQTARKLSHLYQFRSPLLVNVP